MIRRVAVRSVTSTLLLEDAALVWRVAGKRGRSAQNSMRGRAGHWGAAAGFRRHEREEWLTLLLAAGGLHAVELRWRPPIPAQLTVRVWGGSRPDSCGVADHNKYAIDALVARRLIEDDGPTFVPRTVCEVPSERPDWLPKGEGLEIRVEPMR